MYTGEYIRFGQSEPDYNRTSHVIKILVSVIGGPFEVQLTHICLSTFSILLFVMNSFKRIVNHAWLGKRYAVVEGKENAGYADILSHHYIDLSTVSIYF